ncbi:hypothetical protein Pla108_15990 [Botrimarina colliarenosi]|uniref:DUF4112 domain-containing protein n=1 Tax=Botrimarina colliarenosi TaxID=2528001 RepID=A0A5C6AME3_9BACT|nr:DUF4112 domain-containing protein [Botrimarina colliarenosi]TWU00647.1 hypothetical protein Pla108_15990 [Botrimarina colliarenosi]
MTNSPTPEKAHHHLNKAARWARFLDNRFRIPGTGVGYGFDSLIGLIPGVGDAATTAMACMPIYHAWKAGSPRGLLLRMAFNVGIDAVVGAIPGVGDVADIFLRCNRRNAKLLRKAMANGELTAGDKAVQAGTLPSTGGPPTRPYTGIRAVR